MENYQEVVQGIMEDLERANLEVEVAKRKETELAEDLANKLFEWERHNPESPDYEVYRRAQRLLEDVREGK